TPVEDEPETARGLSTRAELVEKIRALGQDVLDGVKFGFDNAVDQLKIMIPPEYAEMVEDEEDEQEDGEDQGESHGEDGA
ncbi:hypothetical protein A2U01_0058537, partial [Trifolium medium]|nr:hypothetical protein [Trifolium medium]